MTIKYLTFPDPLTLVSLQEAKDWLKVDYVEDDAIIELLIKSAYKEAERYTNSSFLERTIELKGNWNELAYIHGPLSEIISLTYLNSSGDNVDYPTDNIGRLIFNTETYCIVQENIFTLTYKAGSLQVDETIKEAILKAVYSRYETRGNEVIAAQGVSVGTTGLPTTSKDLLTPYVRYGSQ